MIRIACALALAALLASCARAGALQREAEEEMKNANDIAADTLSAMPAAISLGAWYRMEDPRERRAVFYLAVPDAEDFCRGFIAP